MHSELFLTEHFIVDCFIKSRYVRNGFEEGSGSCTGRITSVNLAIKESTSAMFLGRGLLPVICSSIAAAVLTPHAATNSRSRGTPRMAEDPTAPPKFALMINGLPGAMGKEIAAACLRRGIELAPFGMTGDAITDTEVTVDDGHGGTPTTVALFRYEGHPAVATEARGCVGSEGRP